MGMVFVMFVVLMLVVFITVKQWVVGWACCVFDGACIALFCRSRLFMCLFLQHDSRWRHVPFWWDVHRFTGRSLHCKVEQPCETLQSLDNCQNNYS